MSGTGTIAAVTGALAQRIRQAVQSMDDISAAPDVSIGRPTQDQGFVGVNLHLLRLAPSAFRRNADLQTRTPEGQLSRRPTAALTLDFLVSFYGSEARMEPQRLAGRVLAELHASPILTPANILAAAEAAGDMVPVPKESIPTESVSLTFTPLDLEDMYRLWSLFTGSVPALSVLYSASVVFVAADRIPSTALPVREPQFGATPQQPPEIAAVRPSPLSFGFDRRLVVAMSKPGGEPRSIRLGEAVLPAVLGPDGLTLDLATHWASLRAGVMELQVLAGDPPIPSAVQSLQIAPHLADGASYRTVVDPRTGMDIGSVVLRLTPRLGIEQAAELRLVPLPDPRDPTATAGLRSYVYQDLMRLTLDPALASLLGEGEVPRALRTALADRGQPLAADATLVRQGDAWLAADGSAAVRLESGVRGLVAYTGLTPGDPQGSIAFRIPGAAPGRYLLAVAVDGGTVASPLRRGAHLLDLALGSVTAAGPVPASVVTAFAAAGIALTAGAVLDQVLPEDGWRIDDGSRRYWLMRLPDRFAVYDLSVPGTTFVGPAVTVERGP